ncbi:uncharacterized protein LOC113062505 isoform X2 [Carassius auratus]|uniref:Uncharacterized protein LOC113062505 isoform X2 n=1 Tax=Carassius auratus TaxID=7957 RepID=A0A6P6LUN6_CARAU|nr:uncharacterized protein LOC113062505 isoform X2 [Carassius auratus]
MKRNQNIQQFFISKKSKPDEDSELIRAADVSSTSSGSDNVSESDQDDDRQLHLMTWIQTRVLETLQILIGVHHHHLVHVQLQTQPLDLMTSPNQGQQIQLNLC